jgi:hypothetical protein
MILERHRIAELQGEFPLQWCLERRTAYLKDSVTDLTCTYWHEREILVQFVRRVRPAEIVLTKERMDATIKQIMKHLGELYRIRDKARGIEPDITEVMIERARAYPFTQLYEFRRNVARCPFHEDHTPSFALMKDNTARCFGACGRYWDTIAFLRDRDGLSFPQAVRALQ